MCAYLCIQLLSMNNCIHYYLHMCLLLITSIMCIITCNALLSNYCSNLGFASAFLSYAQ